MSALQVTLGDLIRAAKESDLDASCRILQDKAGIRDGGIASVMFSGEEFGNYYDQDGYRESTWPRFAEQRRFHHLLRYLLVELVHEQGEPVFVR